MFDYSNDIGTELELLEPIITSAWKPRKQVSIATTDKIVLQRIANIKLNSRLIMMAIAKGYRPIIRRIDIQCLSFEM